VKYDWIFFDLDNTLLDFHTAARRAFSSALQPFGIREEDGMHEAYEQINHLVWRNFEEGKIDAVTLRHKRFSDFFMIAGIKGVDAREFNTVYLEHLVSHSEMLDGARDLLDSLHGRVRMAAVTNGLKEAQRPRLRHLGLDHYFQTIVVSDEIGHSKPSPEYFDVVMEDCEHPKKDKILLVGDNINSDVRGGLEYGLPTCWCNLDKKENPTDWKPHFEIHSLGELRWILR
jgi:YjjG family noncanonical pyrimidine nucleotidase